MNASLLRGGLVAVVLCIVGGASGDWSRFRGPNGDGVSPGSTPVPTEWSDTKNLQWKTALPGPGQSCPIVVGDKVFVTCWSGYGESQQNPGNIEDLRRHLICVDRNTGKVLWDKSVEPVLPEEPYRGMFAQHGYASHTPVSDGERVYAFFGKTGVYAYDMEGKELWHKSVGTNDDRRHWGTASSPVLYKDLLIVPATIESHSIIAFNKLTGEEVWKQQADGLDSTWSTPILVETEGRTDLVIGVPYEVWGLNPENGKLRWYCSSSDSDSMCSSVVAHNGVVYALERGGSVAVKAGGTGDVSKTHVVWTGNHQNRINTPVVHDGRLYFISSGRFSCLDAASSELAYQGRIERSSAAPAGGNEGDRGGGGRPGGGFGGGGFGGRGGGPGGGQDYSSPVIADGKLYYFTRSGEGIVVRLTNSYEQIATNRFESDSSDFSSTPAIDNGQIFIRSNKALYCVSEK
jgi:outer membrane protein assembly factor BamB